MQTNNVKRPNKSAALEDVSVHGVGSAAKYIIREARHNFALLHHPNAWSLTVDGEWLPVLSEVDIRPGGNYTGGLVGDENLSQFREWFSKKNMTYINPTDKRLGEFKGFVCHKPGLFAGKGGSYKAKQTHYYLGKGICSLLTEIQNNGNILIVPTLNDDKYNEFRRHLVQSGIIEPVSEEVLHKELEILISTRDRMSQFDKLSETATKELNKNKALIAIIEKQLADLDEEYPVELDVSTALEDDSAEALDFAPTPPTKKGRK